MVLVVRELRPEETRTFLEVIRAAVRGTAAADYPPEVIEAWAPLPVTNAEVDEAQANPEDEIRVAAILDGKIAGVGAVIPQGRELRACYVSPDASRCGVGKSLVEEIERIARQHDVPFLDLDSSITAEPFYRKLGYAVVARGEHTLSSGARMAAVMMRKDL
jgi:putative acetyltransferase